MNIGKRAAYGSYIFLRWNDLFYLDFWCCFTDVLSIYERSLVEETLAPLDQNRRAFRLVGGILVERTVGEVLPSVITNRNNLEKLIESLSSKLQQRQKESSDLKKKYNLQTPEEQEAMLRRRQQQ